MLPGLRSERTNQPKTCENVYKAVDSIEAFGKQRLVVFLLSMIGSSPSRHALFVGCRQQWRCSPAAQISVGAWCFDHVAVLAMEF